MKLKSGLLFILILYHSTTMLGQSINPGFNYNGDDFSPKLNAFVTKRNTPGCYIGNYFHKNFFHLYDSLCNQGAGLVRFRFNESGKLIDLSCSKTFPRILNQALKTAVLASEKYWVISGIESYSKWIVLPVIYDYHVICDDNRQSIKHDTYDDSGGMFRFEDNTVVKDLECMLLEPMLISTGILDRELVPPPGNRKH